MIHDYLSFPVIILLSACVSLAEGPILRAKDPLIQQEYENVYQDIRGVKSKLASLFVNVKDYGAKGDGIANDHDAIQAAHDSIITSGKPGTLLLPGGTYKVNSQLKINVGFVSVMGLQATLDFSALTSGTTALWVTGGTNTYFGNPYFNADKKIEGINIFGPGRTTSTCGMWFYSASEPGPSHVKLYNVNSSAFGKNVVIGDNAYLISFIGCDFWISSINVHCPIATNAGEGIILDHCRLYNSETGVLNENVFLDMYVSNTSIDGMDVNYLTFLTGEITIDSVHLEGNFGPSLPYVHLLWVPPTATSAVYAAVNNSLMVIKGTRSDGAFHLNNSTYLRMVGGHVNNSGGSSVPVIIATGSFSGGAVEINGLINTTADSLFRNDVGMENWINKGGFVTTSKNLTYYGVSAANNANPGEFGESISSATSSSNPYQLTNGQYLDLASVVLSSGDWDVSSCTQFLAFTGITGTQFESGIGTASGNSGTGLVSGNTEGQTPTPPTTSSDISICVSPVRKSIGSTTTYYLKAQATFSAGTLKACGRISARRAR